MEEKGLPDKLIEEYPDLGEWAILTAYWGSIAYGMDEPQRKEGPPSDRDIMSVCVPPRSYFLGLDEYGSRGTREIEWQSWDIVNYEIRKYFHLLVKGNPNAFLLLWLEPQFYLCRRRAGDLLCHHRELFSTKQVFHSFVGYAHGQLKRMTHFDTSGGMGEKRRKLVAQFGYDTKNAAHLIRLLRMGIEFLETKHMYVYRSDRDELLNIKRGEWSLEEVQREAEKLFSQGQNLLGQSPLLEEVDLDRAGELCVQVVEAAWEERSYATPWKQQLTKQKG